MRSTSIASGFLLFQIHFLLDDALKQLQMISEGVYLLFVSLKQLLMFKNEVDGCDGMPRPKMWFHVKHLSHRLSFASFVASCTQTVFRHSVHQSSFF
jgi:hypothetical protein